MNLLIRMWSLTPGADSMPDATSTAHGRTVFIASNTLSGFNPPAKMSRPLGLAGHNRQSNALPVPPWRSGAQASKR